MKKLVLLLGLGIGTLGYSQYYPSYQYPNNNGAYGNYGSSYNDGYFYNDGFYDHAVQNFPDDYFYNYPVDYYPSDYYQNYYNDYRNSIVNINWNLFFSQNRLSRRQIQMIINLNNQFASFSAWNAYYGMNPNRWYYDRFYILEQILGPQIFIVFQNNYYQGYSPVVYFQNYWRTNYAPRYICMPKYRSINVSNYRNDRQRFFVDKAPQYRYAERKDGFRNGINTSDSANRGNSSRGDSGFRNPVRTETAESRPVSGGSRNTGATRDFNSGSRPQSVRNSESRGSEARNDSGFRSGVGRSESSSSQRSAASSSGSRGFGRS